MSYSPNKKGALARNADAGLSTAHDVAEIEGSIQISRRRFMRRIGAGAAALAMTACGGGGSGGTIGTAPVSGSNPPSTTASNGAPEWNAVPTITFTEGVAATISIAGYVSDTDALAITKNSLALPPGVTYDAASKSFVYDGSGGVAMTDGHVLTAVEV